MTPESFVVLPIFGFILTALFAIMVRPRSRPSKWVLSLLLGWEFGVIGAAVGVVCGVQWLGLIGGLAIGTALGGVLLRILPS